MPWHDFNCYSGSKLVQGLQIRCYLDSTLLGMSGFFTPPEARPPRPAHLQPEVAELGDMQEKRRTRRARRSRVKLAQNAAQIFSCYREGPLSGWQSVWPIWRESRPKCRHRTVAEGGCKWWMEVVRCSNCVQVIDSAPHLFFCFPPAEPCTPSLLCSCPTHERKHQQRYVSSESWQPTCLGYSSYVGVAAPYVLGMRIMNLWIQPYKSITVPVKKISNNSNNMLHINLKQKTWFGGMHFVEASRSCLELDVYSTNTRNTNMQFQFLKLQLQELRLIHFWMLILVSLNNQSLLLIKSRASQKLSLRLITFFFF